MKRLAAVVSCLVTMTVASTSAFADEGDAPEALPTAPPQISETNAGTVDAVHLRGGGLYRGRVTEIVPGSHVLVMMTSGETHKVPWNQVDRVIVASTNIPALPGRGAAPAETPAAPVAAKAGPLARVHLKTKGAILYRRAAGTEDFVTACEYPCDEPMPLGDTYKVGGNGMKTSKEFQLHGSAGDTIDVEADGPSWLGIVGGGTLVMGGAVTAYFGTLLALAGSACHGGSSCSDVGTAGVAALGIGAGAIALGLVIIYPSMKTDIEQERVSPQRDAFLRQPTWRTATAHEGSAPGTAFPMVFTKQF